MDINTIKSTNPDVLYTKAINYLNENDYNNYVICMTMSANLGNSDAIAHLDIDYINNGIYKKQDHLITKSFYEQTVEYGYSANYLGYMYKHGEGVTQDYNKARELYERAIDKGNATAMYNLGYMYHYGEGVTQDCNIAMELFENAIDKGNADAMNNLGYIYHRGEGATQDYNKARELYERAIDKGHALAMNNLGNMYYSGKGVTQDYNKARELYERAIDKGNALAMNNLLSMYKTIKTFDKQQVIDYFIKINSVDKLKEIYKYDDYDLNMIFEIKRLKNENNLMKSHIESSPDGEQFN